MLALALTLMFHAPTEPPPAADTQALVAEVKGMDCGGCADRAKKVLARVDGVTAVAADWQKGEIAITCSKRTAQKALREAIQKAGFELVSLGPPKKG